jgi:cytochrome c553
MQKISLAMMMGAAFVLSACSTSERSRTLGDPDVSGRTIAQQVCSTCHGIDGNSVSPQYPKLAGQTEVYMTQQLNGFNHHLRTDRLAIEIMAGMSRDISIAQTKEIAEYFASQKLINEANDGSVDTSKGKDIFQNGIPDRGLPACASCHGSEAKGQLTFPRLAGQHKAYLVKQLHVFKDTHGRPNTPMDFVIKNLSEKEIEHVATYLSRIEAVQD